MNKRTTLLLVILSMALCTGHGQVIPFSSERWVITAQEQSLETYKGHECLMMKGGIAYLGDVDFLNGTIEFDLAIPDARGFMGAVWRLKDLMNYEEFYLRSHQSGNPDACQYTPVFNGVAGWQLYHGEGYGVPLKHTFNEWTRVRIIVAGDMGQVYISDMEKPAFTIYDMKMESNSGKIGVKINNFAPGRIANFSYILEDEPGLMEYTLPEATDRTGMITSWKVSAPFKEEVLADAELLPEDLVSEFINVKCEESGTVNLASVAKITEGNTVLAVAEIHSSSAQMKLLELGYSDRIRVYLNGKAIYSGNNTYMTRDYRYLGTIGFFDALYLPLNEGNNVLSLAVSESFGGWGLKARIPDQASISLTE